jgi:hypothetical protein
VSDSPESCRWYSKYLSGDTESPHDASAVALSPNFQWAFFHNDIFDLIKHSQSTRASNSRLHFGNEDIVVPDESRKCYTYLDRNSESDQEIFLNLRISMYNSTLVFADWISILSFISARAAVTSLRYLILHPHSTIRIPL